MRNPLPLGTAVLLSLAAILAHPVLAPPPPPANPALLARSAHPAALAPPASALNPAPVPVGAVAEMATVAAASQAGNDLFVSPKGRDTNAGTSSSSPLRTIQEALERAGPGDTVRLAAGTYLQDLQTVRSGAPGAPITIMGPAKAVIKGAGHTYVAEVNHDHHVFSGFTIDGRFGKDRISGYRKKLLYARGTQPGVGVSGLKVLNMKLVNALDECVRLRYLARDNEVAGNRIGPCGLEDFRFGGGGKNGEGIYVGTAPEQLGGNPTDEPDVSSDNRIHDNTISASGECVDLKEGARQNTVFDNSCTGALDPDSGGIDSRGNDNTIRGNKIVRAAGAGVRLGGDTAQDGTGNDVVGNDLIDNAVGGIKFMAQPQGQVCENTVTGSPAAVGTFRQQFNPTANC